MKKEIKKVLKETKEKKEKLLIERKLIKSRILMIFENENNIKNFENLSEEKKIKYSFQLMSELAYQSDNGVLSEGLLDLIKSIFGTTVGGDLGQAILEPAVNYISTGLGIQDSYLKSFIISFITKKEGFWNSFKDCPTLTKAIAESIIEAFITKGQQALGKGSFWMDALRNMLGDGATKIAMVSSMEKQISDTVCQFFGKATNNANQVLTKLNN